MKINKILAIDLGQKRIGLALLEQDIVRGLETLKYRNLEDALGKLSKIIHSEEIEKIIIGLPKGNQRSEDQARSFAQNLNKLIEIPVEYTDESLTSREAERLLKDSKLNPRSEKYKCEVDKISAKLILEQYLNSLK